MPCTPRRRAIDLQARPREPRHRVQANGPAWASRNQAARRPRDRPRPCHDHPAGAHAKIHTVEHVLSALSGCGVDNLTIEMNASEPPILDGSAREFVKLIQQGEPVEQDAEREYFSLADTVSVSRGNSSIIALPFDGLKITCTSADDRGIHTQHLSLTIDPEVYVTQVAAARTFTIYEDIEETAQTRQDQGRLARQRHRHQGRQDHLQGAAPLRRRVRPSQDPRYHRGHRPSRRAAEGAYRGHAPGATRSTPS